MEVAAVAGAFVLVIASHPGNRAAQMRTGLLDHPDIAGRDRSRGIFLRHKDADHHALVRHRRVVKRTGHAILPGHCCAALWRYPIWTNLHIQRRRIGTLRVQKPKDDADVDQTDHGADAPITTIMNRLRLTCPGDRATTAIQPSSSSLAASRSGGYSPATRNIPMIAQPDRPLLWEMHLQPSEIALLPPPAGVAPVAEHLRTQTQKIGWARGARWIRLQYTVQEDGTEVRPPDTWTTLSPTCSPSAKGNTLSI